jgi:hypothetical protein
VAKCAAVCRTNPYDFDFLTLGKVVQERNLGEPKEGAMKCVICKKGSTTPGTTTITQERFLYDGC